MPKVIQIHRKNAVDSAVDKCVHFGFCTAVCPTYVLDNEENDSPRGRIALAKEMLAGGKPKSKAIEHLDRCLSCLSCETTCAANVPYREIIDGAREYIELSGVRPWRDRVFRAFLAKTLTTPRLLRVASQLGKLMPRSLAMKSGPLGALASLSHAPAVSALRARHEEPAMPPTRLSGRRVALLNGCVQSVIGMEINAAARRLLERSGVAVVDIDESLCCGALELHMGKRKTGAERSARFVQTLARMLETKDVEAFVTTTSGCNSVVQQFDEVLSDRLDLAEQVTTVTSATHDITQYVLELDLECSGAAEGVCVSYHDACSMTHGLKLTSPPRQLFKRLNVDQRNIAEAHMCCGSAGVYNILQPEISERLGKRKAEHASAGNPDVIAAANLGCLVQISRFTSIPVAHTVQILDWVTGGPAPRGLENFEPRPMAAPVSNAQHVEAEATTTEDAFW